MNFSADTEYEVVIPEGQVDLNGILYIPSKAIGLVLFVHGSGSSRLSVRNQYVAKILNQGQIATLLFDLFTPEEDERDSQDASLRFDIDFLAQRLINVTQWCVKNIEPKLNIAYFGASTGGGAALAAAAKLNNTIKAVISRGGRPDLAESALPLVKSPTLLIVGGNDGPVIQMNQSAFSKMHCIKQLEIVPNATHLFEEPGTLEKVAELTSHWLHRYL